MTGQRYLLNLQRDINKSLERLSSGYRINSASDDAAGLAISTRLRVDTASNRQASKNAIQAISMLQTAEGALSSIDAILLRMKELSVQAASANASSNFDKLDEIDRISNSTKYEDTVLLNGNLLDQGLRFQVGSGSASQDSITIEIGDATLEGLGLKTWEEPEKAGFEFLINTQTAGVQKESSVTSISGGRYVVTWQSDGQDGNSYGIYGQMYDRSGNAVGSEFLVNTETALEQTSPSVTGYNNGFVVTWQSRNQDGSDYGIYGQMYDSSGNAIGAEFRINSETSLGQEAPSVTGLSDDGFVVTWQSAGQDTSGNGIYGQIYNISGNAVGSEFRINNETSLGQEAPSITGLSDGGFVVTWQSDGQVYMDKGMIALGTRKDQNF